MLLKRPIVAFLLGILFGCYITPKELLHVLQHHTDTEHHISYGLHIDEAHHHCELQKADQQLVSIEPPLFYCIANIVLFAQPINCRPVVSVLLSPQHRAWNDRGPPSFLV